MSEPTGELTGLTIAEARAKLRDKEITARELTEAYLAAIDAANGALNAYILTTPDKALDMAKASDARLAQGRGAGRWKACRSASRTCSAPKGVRTTAGCHVLDGFKPRYESTVTANLWADGAVMLGKLNMDEFAMGSSNETSHLRPGGQSVARPGSDNAAGARRLLGRLGRGGRGRLCAGRHGHRYRRLDPPAGGLHRHGRHQADLWPLLALGHRRLRLVARPGRADRPHGARRRDPAELDGRPRPEGSTTSATCRCRTSRRRSASRSRACKIGIPKEYRVDGMPARSRRSGRRASPG